MNKVLSRFKDVKPGTKFLDKLGNDYYFETVNEDGAIFIDSVNGWLIQVNNLWAEKGKIDFYKYDILRNLAK